MGCAFRGKLLSYCSITEINILHMIVIMKRERLTCVGSNRYVKTKATINSQHEYDPNTDSDYLLYEDAAKFHGWAVVLIWHRSNLNSEDHVEKIAYVDYLMIFTNVLLLKLIYSFLYQLQNNLKYYPPEQASLTPNIGWFNLVQKGGATHDYQSWCIQWNAHVVTHFVYKL